MRDERHEGDEVGDETLQKRCDMGDELREDEFHHCVGASSSWWGQSLVSLASCNGHWRSNLGSEVVNIVVQESYRCEGLWNEWSRVRPRPELETPPVSRRFGDAVVSGTVSGPK